VESGQKIGIVGRTGRGKSSLFNVLLRLQEISSGTIRISGLTTMLKLQDLRNTIAVVPQTPVIFKDTFRNNLDPCQTYSNEEILQVIQSVYLGNFYSLLPLGLHSQISDSEMSLGEKQLLCVARAILKKSKIVILDEPTASLDIETSQLVKKIITESFKHTTVFFIVHHLSLVMDYDKIMVMNKGELIEFDKPFSLIKNEKGLFSQMLHASGEKTAENLKQLAFDALNK